MRVRPGAVPVTIIRAVLTRWTSHYLAYRCLLELRRSLEVLIEEDEALEENQLITGNTAVQVKATEMIGYLKNDSFWAAIKQ